MGDYFESVVDLDAGAGDAARLAERVVGWLVGEGIVGAEAVEGCVFGRELGHLAGPGWERAVAPEDIRYGPGDGVAVHTERYVFVNPGGEPQAAHCPRCTATIRFETADGQLIQEAWTPFMAAVGAWYETGVGEAVCPVCAEPVAITEWIWDGDSFAPAHLGFVFWNWPPLTPEFRARIAGLLDGHRTVRVRGKL